VNLPINSAQIDVGFVSERNYRGPSKHKINCAAHPAEASVAACIESVRMGHSGKKILVSRVTA
jgi:hypothetical protein